MLLARRLACSATLCLTAVAALSASRGAAADYAAPISGPEFDRDQAAPADEQPAALAATDVECMAKVVMHEAGSEPRDGKVAVAQTLVNRLAAGRFGGSICQVANQPGQFFNTAAYRPDRDGEGWTDAVAVARAVLSGAEDVVAPGAMFFRAAASPASGFMRTRQRVAEIGAQVFYR